MLPQHPRIVRLSDVGSDERGRRWRVMPFAEGVGLASYAERRGLPAVQRARLMLQVCELVEQAHAEHVALGVLKPSRLRVDDEGRVLLLDWGDGRALRADTTAADVRALGDVLQALREAGRSRSGIADADLAAVQARAQGSGPPYASAQALADDLRLVLAFRAVPGAHAGPWHRGRLFLRRRRLVLAAGALGALLVVSVGVLGLRHLQRGEAHVQRGQQLQEFLRDNQLDAAADAAPDIALQAPRLPRARAGTAGLCRRAGAARPGAHGACRALPWPGAARAGAGGAARGGRAA